jgi:hypothetical protein
MNKIKVLNPYMSAIWLYMQICDRFSLTYTLTDKHAFPEEADQKRIFRSEPNAKRRIIVSFIHNQLLLKKIIDDKKLWTFVKKLDSFLIAAIEAKNDPTALIAFEYPKDPFALDEFPEITKEMIVAEITLGTQKIENATTSIVSIPWNPDANYETTQHYRRTTAK